MESIKFWMKKINQGAILLEVSSPGLDRVLKKERDFQRKKEKSRIEVISSRDGQKQFEGIFGKFG